MRKINHSSKDSVIHSNKITVFFFFALDVLQTLAEKELEARRKVLEERRLREEARLASLSTNSPS
jgi:hypothetical protein